MVQQLLLKLLVLMIGSACSIIWLKLYKKKICKKERIHIYSKSTSMQDIDVRLDRAWATPSLLFLMTILNFPTTYMPLLWQISLLSNRVVTLPWQVSMLQPQQIFGANRTIMRKPQGGLQSWPWKRYQPWFLFSSLRRWSKHTYLKYPSGNLNW